MSRRLVSKQQELSLLTSRVGMWISCSPLYRDMSCSNVAMAWPSDSRVPHTIFIWNRPQQEENEIKGEHATFCNQHSQELKHTHTHTLILMQTHSLFKRLQACNYIPYNRLSHVYIHPTMCTNVLSFQFS